MGPPRKFTLFSSISGELTLKGDLSKYQVKDLNPYARDIKVITEASGFVIGGSNTNETIYKLTAINGVPITELEAKMRPKQESLAGFLGEDEKLLDVLVMDNTTVKEAGLTHQKVAHPLKLVNALLRYWSKIQSIHIDETIFSRNRDGYFRKIVDQKDIEKLEYSKHINFADLTAYRVAFQELKKAQSKFEAHYKSYSEQMKVYRKIIDKHIYQQNDDNIVRSLKKLLDLSHQGFYLETALKLKNEVKLFAMQIAENVQQLESRIKEQTDIYVRQDIINQKNKAATFLADIQKAATLVDSIIEETEGYFKAKEEYNQSRFKFTKWIIDTPKVYFSYNGEKYCAEFRTSAGSQPTPFEMFIDDNLPLNHYDRGGADSVVTRLRDGKQLHIPELVVSLIEKFGFYEGTGTQMRVPPEEIIEFFNLKP